MVIANIAALMAALLWAFSGIISRNCTKSMGALLFNQIRITFSFLTLLILLVPQGLFEGIDFQSFLWLSVSGLVGIFIGDTMLFEGLKRLGARLNAVLFATNAPMSAILAFFIFNEKWNAWLVIGTVAVSFGTILAIMYGVKNRSGNNFDRIDGSVKIGVFISLGAALCQSIGLLLLKNKELDFDPLAMNCIRVGAGALALNIFGFIRMKSKKTRPLSISMKSYTVAFLSSFLGLTAGMSLIVFAVRTGHLGVVSTLSATTPLLLTFILWGITKVRPTALSLLGSVFVVVGSGIIFILGN